MNNKKQDKKEIKWMPKPAVHNYDASTSYLALTYAEPKVKKIVDKLRKAKMSSFKAKDIFRASKLSLLGVSNSHVEKNFKKIDDGIELSPIVLVRDSYNNTVIVADGYHRLCAVYHILEDSDIPCKIVSDIR